MTGFGPEFGLVRRGRNSLSTREVRTGGAGDLLEPPAKWRIRTDCERA